MMQKRESHVAGAVFLNICDAGLDLVSSWSLLGTGQFLSSLGRPSRKHFWKFFSDSFSVLS